MKTTKEKIIENAINIMAEQGYEKTSIREIAQKSNIAKGTVYNYFENKKSLYNYLINLGLKFLTSNIKEKIDSKKNIIEKIKVIIETYINFYKNNFNYGKLLLREIWGYKNIYEKDIKKLRFFHISIIKKSLEDDFKANKIKNNIDLEIIIVSLIGIINLTILHWKKIDNSFPAEKIKNHIINIYLSGIVNKKNLTG